MNGTDVLVLIDGQVVGSQRGVTFEENTAEIDVSSKDSRAMRVIPGRYSATASFDGLYVPDDTAYLMLQDANRQGFLVTLIKQVAGSVIESCAALVTKISEAAPDQDAATVSIDIRVDGEWVSGS
jgi:predicted secreted protein